MIIEQNYQFRTNKYSDNSKYIRDASCFPDDVDYVIHDGIAVYIERASGDVLHQAALDFQRFLLACMDVSARITYFDAESAQIRVQVDESVGSYKSFRMEVSEKGISIVAHDERGAQQALYCLEQMMRTRRAPYIAFGTEERKPLFSPRMIHSGFAGNYPYPDVYLREIAYAGYDAIIIVSSDVDSCGGRFFDIDELIFRAARYGLDVYFYSAIPSKYSPDQVDAEAYYESTYGQLFEKHPGIKGIVFVGESIVIPTKDKNSMPTTYDKNFTDGIPNHKPSADVWPCVDYAHWVSLVNRIIKKHKPSADVVFWTYNFGQVNAPFEFRKQLLEALPTDISLMVTFEMFQKIKLEDTFMRCTDYTLAFEGPSDHFVSEAEIAKRRGIRLYAMSNTSGRTWDFGGLPYEPMPQQWMKRFAALKDAQEKWGLCGLVESHHYGFWPSVISELAKECLENTGNTDEQAFDSVLRKNYGRENIAETKKAFELWSSAIRKITPTCEDQYGAFRVGPAYPFNLVEATRIPLSPKNAPKGFYALFYPQDNNGGKPLTGLRIRKEISSLESMKDDMDAGISILEDITEKNEELLSLIRLGKFTSCCITTGILAKKWFILRQKMLIEGDAYAARELGDQAEAILKEERKNVEAAIPLALQDSRLGFEPNMGYVCSEKELRWKLRQIDYVLESELRAYRAGISDYDDYERLFMIYTVSRP